MSAPPSPPPPAVLNRDFLNRQTAGDHALQRELLALFERQCAQVLRALACTRDPARRADAAHGLRGAASALGAEQVAARASDLEHASAAGRFVPHDDLVDAVEAVRAVLAMARERGGLAKPGGPA